MSFGRRPKRMSMELAATTRPPTVAALRFPATVRGRQSCRFLETASLYPPPAALRRFPPISADFPSPAFFKKTKLFQKNCLTNHLPSVILVCARCGCRYGGVAQLARAFGSYPECHWFESSRRYQFGKHRKMLSFIWPVGQVVKTPPFHGGNTSSSLVRVTRRLSSAG